MPDRPLDFDFHGVRVAVDSEDGDCLSFVASDFSFFRVPPGTPRRAPDLQVSVSPGRPPRGSLPADARQVFRTKDAVVYKRGPVEYFDSPGRGLVIHDFARERAELHGPDRDFVYERCYLLVLSRVGAMLDRRGLHRVHAMGVTRDGAAALCLLPMGGGKTTLALSLLERDGFALLSEEIPLVSRDGRLHPFPIRIGVTPETPLPYPREFLKPFRRTRHGPKTLIDVCCFAGRIAPAAPPRVLFVGRRAGASPPRIVAIPRLRALGPLVRLCVLGSGVPQLLEYLVPYGAMGMARELPVVLSRLRACLALLRRCATYELRLSSDRTANADLVSGFLAREAR